MSMSMETRMQVEQIAANLRRIQVQAADSDATLRQDYLSEELENHLTDMSVREREEIINGLRQRFPSFQDGSSPQPEHEPPKTVIEREPVTLSLDDHVDALLLGADDLSADQIKAIAKRLGISGAPKQAMDISGIGAESSLDLPPLKSPPLVALRRRPDEAVVLLDILVDFALGLDQHVWQVWQGMGGANSSVRRNSQLSRELDTFLAGEDNQFGEVCNDLFRLLIALLRALGQGPREYASALANKLSPQEITTLAEIEGKAWHQKWEEVFWNKYQELSHSLTADELRDDLMRSIATLTEQKYLAKLNQEALERK